MSRKEDISKIEEEIKKTKYNKHTQYHIGLLKARLAKLREEEEKEKLKKGKGVSFSIKKSGDATVILTGFPSVGKSTLLNKITRAESKVGDYDFTTLNIIPGVMEYNSAKIQFFDIPGIVSGASSGKGRGKEIFSAIRIADLILIMVDKEKQIEVINRELHKAGFRLNEKKPDVVIQKTFSGGIKFGSTVKQRKIDEKMVKLILKEEGIHNADVLLREELAQDRFIDCLHNNRVYVPSIIIFNKIDLMNSKEINRIKNRTECIMVSSTKGTNIEKLKKRIWEVLDLIRVYTKKIGKKPDMEKPLIIKSGSKIRDVAKRLHRDFSGNLEYAKIWGPSAKFPGQKVGENRMVRDKDIVELHAK